MSKLFPKSSGIIASIFFITLAGIQTPYAQTAQEQATEISREIFGPRRPVDLAYGAFQRGYYITALSLALKRAEQNDAAAQTLVATIYANGLGVAQNMSLAASWYDIASKNGDINATFELALLYQNGLGVPKNRALAAELFQTAADANHREAMYNLALLHVEGIYEDPDLTLAAQLMEKAANAGLSEAHYDYGIMLIQGIAVAPNVTLGARHIELAAQGGLLDAQVEYATLLYLGKGIEQISPKAFSWYQQAANGGSAVAQNRLAKLLAVGEGTTLDLQTAAMWRSLAQRQGLNDPQLDALLISITPEDLAKALQPCPVLAQPSPSQTTGVTSVPQNIRPTFQIQDTTPKLLDTQGTSPPRPQGASSITNVK